MNKILTILFFLGFLVTSTKNYSQNNLHVQNYNSDTLCLFEEDYIVLYKVKTTDYLNEIKEQLPDSIYQTIKSYITITQDSIALRKRESDCIESIYYLSLDFYDRSLHDLVFDRTIYNLFINKKLTIIKDEIYYSVNNTKIKTKRFYCCNNPFLYCGKEWIILCNKKEISRLIKSVTSKIYVVRSCF